MAPVTTRRKPAGPKPFAWSYSKLKNFEACPKKHWHVDLQRDFKEDESDNLLWGNAVHSAAAKRLSKKEPLPPTMEKLLEEWCARIEGPQPLPSGVTLVVEQKLAITKEFGKCGYFDDDAWFRGVGDVIKIVGGAALIIDWKTGKIVEDSQQLALMAACVFAHYPEVQRVRSQFVWLKEDADTREDFQRDKMVEFWRGIWPRIQALEHAHNTTTYPPKPSGLCKRWCPVKACPHWGE
jgi:uncharacterized protein Usg